MEWRDPVARDAGATLHLRALSDHHLPHGLLATSATGSPSSGVWPDGSERCLLHDHWLVRTVDQTKKKDRVAFTLSFNAVVAIDGVRLSDESRWRDQLTKKLTILRLMDYGLKGRSQGGSALRSTSTFLDWWIRWRLSVGVEVASDLTRAHFDDYVSLASQGVSALVPITKRLHDLVDAVRRGEEFLFVGSRNGRSVVDWFLLADRLGVTAQSLWQSPEFLSELIDSLPILAPEVCSTLGSQLARDVQKTRSAKIKDVLAPWRVMSHLSRLGLLPHDPLSFDPFSDPASAALVRRRMRPAARTSTILPDDLLRLMSAAAVWVLDYGHHVIAAWEATLDLANRDVRDPSERDRVAASLLTQAPIGFPSLRLVIRRANHVRNEGRMSATDAVRHLLTACGVLVGSFGARRVGEITSLRADCLVAERPGFLGLTIYIEKSLRDLDTIPVPAMMRNVISTLERLTASTRAVTGREWLFEVGAGERCRSFVGFDLSRDLSDFARVAGLVPPSGQDRWDLKAHQLRRGFAVAYYHGFRAASLDALSRFLRHLDPEMTRVYINHVTSGGMGRLREEIDARTRVALASIPEEERMWIADAKRLLQDISDRGDAFEEVRCEALVHRMLGLWDGTERPIGIGVRSLRGDLDAMVREAEATIRLSSRSNDPEAIRMPLLSRLQNYARTHRLEPVPGGPAHCTARPNDGEDLSRAECLRSKRQSKRTTTNPCERTEPDFAYASAYVCLRCPLCVVFEDGQRILHDIEERFSLASQRAATPAAATSASARLSAFKAAVRSARESNESRA